MTSSSLDGQTAFITGAAGGIGAAIARKLASAGSPVALVDLAIGGVESLAQEITDSGGTARPYGADVTSRSQVEEAIERVARDLGPPRLGVAASGVINPIPFLRLDDASWNRTLAVNLTGAFITVQELGRLMVEGGEGGALVVIASVAGRGPRPDSADYAASKAGAISLVRSAAVALAGHGIRVNAVCPGVVDTPMTRRIHEARSRQGGSTPQDSLQSLVERIPLGRIEQPEEVAEAVMYLLSNQAGYVTGQALNVCGGLEFD